MTISEILSSVSKRKNADALWLLSALLGRSKSEILLDQKNELTISEYKLWKKWWRERESGKPLQYITGLAPFYAQEFFVDKRVLIPRPETERLVELGLQLLAHQPGAKVLDIGTGSGAIALTLKLERPDLQVTASDISTGALAVAKKNAEKFRVAVRFEKQNLFSTKLQQEMWDLVISNPPYLDFRKDKIAPDVRKWEPKLALEPQAILKTKELAERAAWCGEKILQSCAEARPKLTALELSPRVALLLEKRWRKHSAALKVWREADLAGRKRFLLVAWKNG